MTTDDTGETVFWVVQIPICGNESQRTEEFGIFYCENRLQLTAVYRHRREV